MCFIFEHKLGIKQDQKNLEAAVVKNSRHNLSFHYSEQSVGFPTPRRLNNSHSIYLKASSPFEKWEHKKDEYNPLVY